MINSELGTPRAWQRILCNIGLCWIERLFNSSLARIMQNSFEASFSVVRRERTPAWQGTRMRASVSALSSQLHHGQKSSTVARREDFNTYCSSMAGRAPPWRDERTSTHTAPAWQFRSVRGKNEVVKERRSVERKRKKCGQNGHYRAQIAKSCLPAWSFGQQVPLQFNLGHGNLERPPGMSHTDKSSQSDRYQKKQTARTIKGRSISEMSWNKRKVEEETGRIERMGKFDQACSWKPSSIGSIKD